MNKTTSALRSEIIMLNLRENLLKKQSIQLLLKHDEKMLWRFIRKGEE